MFDARKFGLWIGGLGLAILVGGFIYWSSNQPVKAMANASQNPNPWLAGAENSMAAMSAADENLYREVKRNKATTIMIVGGFIGILGAGIAYSSKRSESGASTGRESSASATPPPQLGAISRLSTGSDPGRCPECSAVNPTGTTFCENCGTALPA